MLVEWLRRNVAEFATQLSKFVGTAVRSLEPSRLVARQQESSQAWTASIVTL
jgi:hypothetical protein